MSAPTIPGYYLHMNYAGAWQLFLIQESADGKLYIERQGNRHHYFRKVNDLLGVWVSRVYGPPKDRLIEDYAVKRNSYGS